MRAKAPLLFVLSLLAAAFPLDARSRPLTLTEMARAGERIVVGHVVEKNARWGEGKKMIWTDYTLAVEETWKGAASPTIVVSVAGGTLDGKTIGVTHVPRLEVGGTYALVLYGNEHLYGSPVVGSEQGLFREVIVEGDAAPLLVGADGSVLSLSPQGRLISHEKLAPGLDARHARRPLDVPSSTRSTSKGLGPLVYRDGENHVVTPKEMRKLEGIEGAPAPLTREALRDAVKRALSAEVSR